MEKELDALIQLIESRFPFNKDKYPELQNASLEEELAFSIRHLTLHMAKSTGKIASVSESVDHGEKIDMEEIKKNVPKLVGTTLRLAALVGVSGETIVRYVKEEVR